MYNQMGVARINTAVPFRVCGCFCKEVGLEKGVNSETENFSAKVHPGLLDFKD